LDRQTFKVAFIGAGYMAREHVRTFADLSEVTLSGIYSRTRNKAMDLAKQYGIPIVTDSIGELYEKTQADLVVISVSELSVGEIALTAFQFPWVSLIEKPVGLNLAEAELIHSEAQKAHRRAFVALNRRHYSSTRQVLHGLEGGKEPRVVQVFDQEDPAAALEAGVPAAVVQNWMFANSIHLVDYLRMLGRGAVQSVEPIVAWNGDRPGFVAAKIQFASGDIGLYQAVWNAPGPWAVTVSTSQKRWEMRPLEQATVQSYGSRRLEPLPAHDWDSKFKPGLRLQAQEAIKALRGESHALPNLQDALESMHLVQAIYGEAYRVK
jgi:predicted dehydrogenase